MPIRVYFPRIGDAYVVADTAEEAVALLKLNSNGFTPHFQKESPERIKELPPATTAFQGIKVASFFLGINTNAHNLLLALLKHEKGVRGETFSDETGIAAEKMGGIFGGASKIAKKYELRIEQFVISNMVVKGSERYRFFKPGKLLLEYADKLKEVVKTGTAGVSS
jgi:hypothetical protein